MKGDRKDKHHLLKIFACKTILGNKHNPLKILENSRKDAKGIQVVFYFDRITGFTFFLALKTLYLILCFSHAKGKLHDKTRHARVTPGLCLPLQDFQETFEAHCFNRVWQGEVFVAGINDHFVCGFDFMAGIMKSL